MSRPLRVEYPDAYYHVMSRGRGHQTIFDETFYYQAFLTTLEEAYKRFGVEVHAYCLMPNHYHLLLKTPEANLSRIMRHINGVYTQRYNRLKRTDGPLFRGRYKAVLVEHDEYWLQLTRYIHRNPVEVEIPMVKKLEAYPWSSYPAYLNKVTAPTWLYREETYRLLGHKQRYKQYQGYVELGTDEELEKFYGRSRWSPVLGTEAFRERIYVKHTDPSPEITGTEQLFRRPTIAQIVHGVAEYFSVESPTIYRATRGRGQKNLPRWLAMYLSQQQGGHSLTEIAQAFGLTHYGTVSNTLFRLKQEARKDVVLRQAMQQLEIKIIKQ